MVALPLKPDDAPEPVSLRAVADPQGTLIELQEQLRAIDGTLLQVRELLAECAAMADPARHRRRAQDRVRELCEDASVAQETAERLTRELRMVGVFAAAYDGRGQHGR